MGEVKLTSAAAFISLLEEPRHEIKTFALQRLDNIVDEFWPEISESIEKIEILHEDQVFQQRELAALVASKVYFHLGSYDDSLSYALGAGDLFRVNSSSQYVETLIAKCIDQYTQMRQALFDREETIEADPRLESIVNRMFERCLCEHQYHQAIGIALETRRLDIFEAAITRSNDIQETLKYGYQVTMTHIQHRGFRSKILRLMVNLYRTLDVPDYVNMCQCLTFLADSDSVAQILGRLIDGDLEDQLTAYQIAFDLYDAATQEFLKLIIDALENTQTQAELTTSDSEDQLNLQSVISMSDSNNYKQNVNKLKTILGGDVPILLHSQFLIRTNKVDYLILKHTKESVRASICQTAVIIANGFMNAGTTSDFFLRENLEWLSKATNWSKMVAVSSLGVIHRGHEQNALNFMETYLPKEAGSAGYTESGALYALGLIHANHGEKIVPYLIQQLKEPTTETNSNIKHGGCLGLGLAAMGTCNEEVFSLLRDRLFEDDAVVGEAAGIAMGLVILGSANQVAIDDLVAYAQESQHEKILRGLALALAFTMFARLEEADSLIARLMTDKDPILRRSAMHTIAMAYAGSGNSIAIRKLLHFAVSDVNDDVRRAAVIAIGFLLFRTPSLCPSMVSLLAESYNPHVRYASAMALGIACAGTGLREAIAILEPMIQADPINYVRQGALIASALICIQHTEQTCPRSTALRAQYADVIKNKHEDVMSKFGAIVAQGIIDGGGRNATLSLESRTGHVNMFACVGTMLFTHYWYWYPMAHCLSLAFTPTCLIGLNRDLNMPILQFKSNAKPSTYGYPPAVEEKKREELIRGSSALLSVAARKKKKYDKLKSKLDENLKKAHASSKSGNKSISNDKEKDKEKPKETEKEADFEIISNPARVMQPQLKAVVFVTDGNHVPIKDVSNGGIIMLKRCKIEEEEIVEFVSAHGPSMSEEKEPEPPQPFEWHED
ncbi:26S proteasome non-ATPase regulatory subunit 1-like isoform X2 [Atheta coriaria]|uniref:26S proteasome non-ATPase regulatory subunit 1-like isoform X2 n=1 Tax=Dalotia coriaria TaxID=877792 RepID=UPI0031F36920